MDLTTIGRSGANSGKLIMSETLILMYHRIAESPLDLCRLSVSANHFADHLSIFSKYGSVLSLTRAVHSLQQGVLSENGIVVTFDDGYADNFYNAKPLLELYAVPATVFITSGYVSGNREFWWDELEWLLLEPEVVPGELCLMAADQIFSWPPAQAARQPSDPRQISTDALATGQVVGSSRRELYRALHAFLKPFGESEREKTLNEISDWAGIDRMIRDSHRPLSAEEVANMANGELMELGAHTVTHPSLPALSAEAQFLEIQGSKLRLERLLGRPVSSFAYPYGESAPGTTALVQRAGFALACSTQPGLINYQSDPFFLPRMKVENWDGEEMAKKLAKWFNV
jgi:peptidoglycan/xylan/chitin deacetylase (PgdA/CDA1 family)